MVLIWTELAKVDGDYRLLCCASGIQLDPADRTLRTVCRFLRTSRHSW